MEHVPIPLIDFHVHLFPDRMFNAIRNAFIKDYNWDVRYKMNADECVQYLHDHDVEYIVYSNYAHKKGIAASLNRWNLDILDAHPGTFCFGAFHPDDDDLEHVKEFLQHPRAMGIKLQLLVQKFYPHDERLFPLYEYIITRGKRLLMHTGTGPVGNEFVGFEHFKRALEKYPQLPVNVAHMGAYEYSEFISLLDTHEKLFLDTAYTFFPGTEGGFNLGKKVLENYSDRIVYGSDFPNIIFPREDELNSLDSLELSESFYSKVFYENGLQLLRDSCPDALV